MIEIIMTHVKSMTLCTMLVILALACPVTAGGTPALVKQTIDGGGATSAAGGFVLTGTIGQPDAGPVAMAGGFTLAGGFLAGSGPPCPAADLNGDCVVNGADLGLLLGAWGLCPKPCPPSCPADLNGDCEVFGADLGLLLGQWTG